MRPDGWGVELPLGMGLPSWLRRWVGQALGAVLDTPPGGVLRSRVALAHGTVPLYVQGVKVVVCTCLQADVPLGVHTLIPMTLNSRSYVPIYQQLAEVLREQIRSGALPPGSPIPGENRLAADHGIGRETVRKALSVLRSEGIIVTRKSEGTFVREDKARRTVAIDSTTIVIARMPTPAERVALDLDEGTPVVVIRRGESEPELVPADVVKVTGTK